MMKYTFPEGFLWGSAISSYQVEGGNTNSDWYQWERQNGLASSGEACDHFRRFRDDFALAAALGHKALRFSLEWARIEPREGVFDEYVLERYLEQVSLLESLSIVPVVTLHHFTNPLWISQKGGWTETATIDAFLRYVSKVGDVLAGRVPYYIIINEPMVYVYKGFIEGSWPPGVRSISRARLALRHMMTAYAHAARELKLKDPSHPPRLSIAKNMIWFSPCPAYNLGQNSLSAWIRSRLFNYAVLDKLCAGGLLDFIGVNYYYRQHIRATPDLLGRECRAAHHRERRNALGWHISAEGFLKVLLSLKQYGLPLIVTENGTCEDDPSLYEPFLRDHLAALSGAMRRGVDCRGYLWWSLLDNFEWDQGFSPRFGLVEVDYSTFQRRPRSFAGWYKKVIEDNAVTV